MPRVRILQEKYMMNDLEAYILGQMKVRKLNQDDIGKVCGLSRQTFSNRLQHHSLNNQDLIRIFTLFDTDAETIVKFMKEKK